MSDAKRLLVEVEKHRRRVLDALCDREPPLPDDLRVSVEGTINRAFTEIREGIEARGVGNE